MTLTHLTRALAVPAMMAALASCTAVPDEAPVQKTAATPAAAGAATPAAAAAAKDPSLLHRFSFADGKDSVGALTGTLKGKNIKFQDGKLVLANAGKGSGDAEVSYLELSGTPLPKSGSVSIVFWFTAKDTEAFARVVDFGESDGDGHAFIYFTPRNAEDNCRSAITASDVGSKTNVDSTRLDDGKEHMVAIVINDKVLRVFVDGKEPEPAAELGDNVLAAVKPAHNWLGRSAFDVDPGYTGSINELRVYSKAITLEDAVALAKAGPDAVMPVK